MRFVKLLAAVGVVAATMIFGAGTAHADDSPGCDFNHTCSYDPQWNGQQLNTWDVPHTYGGWTNLPLMCDPPTQRCRMYAPQP